MESKLRTTVRNESGHLLERLAYWEPGVCPPATSGAGVPLPAPLGSSGEPLGPADIYARCHPGLSVTIYGCQGSRGLRWPPDVTHLKVLILRPLPL